MQKKILYFNTQTTGLPTKHADFTNLDVYDSARLVWLSWNFEDKVHDYIVKPEGFEIDPIQAYKYHGITHDHATNHGTPIKEVFDLFLKDVKNADLLVSYNTTFHLNIIKSELYRLSIIDNQMASYIYLINKKDIDCIMLTAGDHYEEERYMKFNTLYKKIYDEDISTFNAKNNVCYYKQCYEYIMGNCI